MTNKIRGLAVGAVLALPLASVSAPLWIQPAGASVLTYGPVVNPGTGETAAQEAAEAAAAAAAAAASENTAPLSFTGIDAVAVTAVGAGAIGAGGLLVLSTRKRRASRFVS